MSTEKDDLVSDLKHTTNRAIEQLREKLDKPQNNKSSQTKLLETVEKQQAIIERMTESAAFLGEVTGIIGDQKDSTSDIVLSCYGRIIFAKPLPKVTLKVGDMVKLAPNSSQIIEVIDRFSTGSICLVRRAVDHYRSEVDFNGTARIVVSGEWVGKLETGDQVILDSSGSVVVAWLGKPARVKFKSKPEATWNDIVGLDHIKQELREAIELPFKKDQQFRHYKRKAFKGAFISGPPGCGKTMLGEASANGLAELYGGEALESGYFYVKGPEFLDMYVGNTEKGIRALADEAEAHFEKHSFPAIIFLDECESLLSRRGSGKSSDMEKTVVPTFLGIMNKSFAIFLLATNRPDVIDPAVIRHGRVNRHFYVSRPTRENSQIILAKNLTKYPLASKENSVEDLAQWTADEFYAEKYVLLDEAIPLKNGKEVFFTAAQIVNGAMLTDIVDRASSIAERRDRKNNQLTGVTIMDLVESVKANFEEQRSLDHRDELKEFFKSIKDQIEPNLLLQKSN